jgi:integrase-like protein
MTLVHDHPTARHLGQDKMIRQAKNCLSWPGMNHWIAQYVRGCMTCQQNKILVHCAKIPLYQINTPLNAHPFQQISMDLITGLPKIRNKDAILTIVDYGCSQAAIFLPCTTTITSLGIATLYLKNIYPWFSLPKKVIIDRDPRFTSHFGKALTT